MLSLLKLQTRIRTKIVFFSLIFFYCGLTNAQDLSNDLSLLLPSTTTKVRKKEKIKLGGAIKKYNPISLSLNGLLSLYQGVISPQISADCLYETSCSRFSRKALGRFGVVKGVFLSADRLSRCNRVSATTIHPTRFNESYRVKDEPYLYSIKYHHKETH